MQRGGKGGGGDAKAGDCPSSQICSPVRGPAFQQHSRLELERITWGRGLGGRGPEGDKEENRLNVLTAVLFFFTYFAQGSGFLLGRRALPGSRLAQQGLFTRAARVLFPSLFKSLLLRERGVGRRN